MDHKWIRDNKANIKKLLNPLLQISSGHHSVISNFEGEYLKNVKTQIIHVMLLTS